METNLEQKETKLEHVKWSYFNKFSIYNDILLPARGDGLTMASQAVTTCCKLVYKWYNDGDVYDNTYYLVGWANDISGPANWLYKYIPETKEILIKIKTCKTTIEYEHILKELCDYIYQDDILNSLNQKPKIGDAYSEEGPFHYQEDCEEDEYDYDYYDEEDDF